MKPAIELGVNIDHVATIREARGTRYPDPVQAAYTAVDAGADSITVHLREDRRHIQERDVRFLNECLTVPLNLEMAATPSMLAFALDVCPEKCCIVPEKREELTTEGGLDVIAAGPALTDACSALQAAGIEVSLFIDPVADQISAAADAGVPVVELHTGNYADAQSDAARATEFEKIVLAASLAVKAGLQVNAGHGLHYQNVARIAAVEEFGELNIGHAIVARALFSGFAEAVREMKRLLVEARR
jgi:pyridoxine 5-phosphate synthase|tara:strand:- start:1992 stop:2726 length:735 start_codon:yes stop_codon:yes gene_type:complete